MAFCCFCGGQLTAEDEFCPGCGAPAGEKAAEQAASEPAPPPAPVQPQPVYMYSPPPVYAPVAAQSERARFCFPANSKFPLAAAIVKTVLIIYSVISQVIYFISMYHSSVYAPPGRRDTWVSQIFGFAVGVLISVFFVVLCLAPVKTRAEWMLAPLALPLMRSFANTVTTPLFSLSPVIRGLITMALTILLAGCMLLALVKKKSYWVLILLALPLLVSFIGGIGGIASKSVFAASLNSLVSTILGTVFVLCFYLAVTGRLRGKAALFALYAAMQVWAVLGGMLVSLRYGSAGAAVLTSVAVSLVDTLFNAVPVVLLIAGLRKAPDQPPANFAQY